MQGTSTSQSNGRANIATGSFTGDGDPVYIELGLTPRYVKVFDMDGAKEARR